MEREREAGREGGVERERGREVGRDGERERGREIGREGGRERVWIYVCIRLFINSFLVGHDGHLDFHTVQVQCCFTSTETIRTIRDGQDGQLDIHAVQVQCCFTSTETTRTTTATSTFRQFKFNVALRPQRP